MHMQILNLYKCKNNPFHPFIYNLMHKKLLVFCELLGLPLLRTDSQIHQKYTYKPCKTCVCVVFTFI